MNTIDKILISCAIAVIVFIVTMIVIFCIYQAVPDTLIECVLNLATSEAVITFAIWWIKKKASSRKDKDNNGLEK
jgi:hypothetical protein